MNAEDKTMRDALRQWRDIKMAQLVLHKRALGRWITKHDWQLTAVATSLIFIGLWLAIG